MKQGEQKALSSALLPSSVQNQYFNLGEEKERAADRKTQNNVPMVFGKHSPQGQKEMKSRECCFHIYNLTLQDSSRQQHAGSTAGEPKNQHNNSN